MEHFGVANALPPAETQPFCRWTRRKDGDAIRVRGPAGSAGGVIRRGGLQGGVGRGSLAYRPRDGVRNGAERMSREGAECALSRSRYPRQSRTPRATRGTPAEQTFATATRVKCSVSDHSAVRQAPRRRAEDFSDGMAPGRLQPWALPNGSPRCHAFGTGTHAGEERTSASLLAHPRVRPRSRRKRREWLWRRCPFRACSFVERVTGSRSGCPVS